jgi:hypothetical protein
MADATYGPKVYKKSGGDVLVIASGGVLDIESGAIIKTNGEQGAALTAQLTTITPADAAGTPDYAIAAVTNSSPYGFSNAAEVITLLYVIQNLQVRLAEVEARLEAAGLVVAN